MIVCDGMVEKWNNEMLSSQYFKCRSESTSYVKTMVQLFNSNIDSRDNMSAILIRFNKENISPTINYKFDFLPHESIFYTEAYTSFALEYCKGLYTIENIGKIIYNNRKTFYKRMYNKLVDIDNQEKMEDTYTILEDFDMYDWYNILENIDMDKYDYIFTKNSITKEVLFNLTNNDLIDLIKSEEDRKIIYNEIQKCRKIFK